MHTWLYINKDGKLMDQALPNLGPSGAHRLPDDGSESLGAHVEGPFLAPTKNGIHPSEVLTSAHSFADLEDCYGAANLPLIKKITAAPEQGSMTSLIPSLTSRGIVFSIGHTESSYEEASAAVAAGATMITHLFNAMRPLHHRNPGVFGVLGIAESLPRPYFGIIADGIHLHPTSVKIAFNAHPAGFILVTDAMHLVGLPDGIYPWTNGRSLIKTGSRLILEGTEDKIAGSSITLIECVSNFWNWGGVSVPQAIRAVTAAPAEMLGLMGRKGTLVGEADADLCILSEQEIEGDKILKVDQVWKFGRKVFDITENALD
jgi:N-acetylglucosamine-6-phosphate deacetylase